MNATRPCPYCAEEIAVDAVRCRYCRSRLAPIDPGRWHRDHAERRIAGVAAAVANALAVPTSTVRLVFIVLTFFHLLGPVLYGALWVLIPPTPGGIAVLDRGIDLARDAARHLRQRFAGPTSPAGRASEPPAPSVMSGGLAP